MAPQAVAATALTLLEDGSTRPAPVTDLAAAGLSDCSIELALGSLSSR